MHDGMISYRDGHDEEKDQDQPFKYMNNSNYRVDLTFKRYENKENNSTAEYKRYSIWNVTRIKERNELTNNFFRKILPAKYSIVYEEFYYICIPNKIRKV